MNDLENRLETAFSTVPDFVPMEEKEDRDVNDATLFDGEPPSFYATKAEVNQINSDLTNLPKIKYREKTVTSLSNGNAYIDQVSIYPNLVSVIPLTPSVRVQGLFIDGTSWYVYTNKNSTEMTLRYYYL